MPDDALILASDLVFIESDRDQPVEDGAVQTCLTCGLPIAQAFGAGLAVCVRGRWVT